MNVIIVDDEASVRNSISRVLRELDPGIKIIAEGSNVEEGYNAVINNKTDLLFLDVEMPDGSGFDLINRLIPVDFKVVFITGHQEYALKAIKMSALDFILKPFGEEDISNAVRKAREAINREQEHAKFRILQENMEGRRVLKRVVLPTADNIHLVSVSDIVRAEADSNYTIFLKDDGQKIMVSRTIKEFDLLLCESGMIRVHQSHLVNLAYIDKFVKKDGGYLMLKDGSAIPVSKNLRKNVMDAINDSVY
jgi:two-component system LytT family response regulator